MKAPSRTKRRPTAAPEALERMAGRVYGVRLEGRLPRRFRPYLAAPPALAGADERELELSYRSLDELPQVDPIWRSAPPMPELPADFTLFRDGEGFGLAIDGASSGVFRFCGSRLELEWVDGPAAAPHLLFSYALPLWLETRGVAMLHASAVRIGDRTAAFLGPSGVGKSTLCAELMRLGCGFVADDGLAVREAARGTWRCSPGPPMLRLWPSALEQRLGIPAARLPRVHGGLEKRRWALRGPPSTTAGGEPDPRLDALYLLQRPRDRAGRIRVVRQTARGALVHLIEYSLAGEPAAALGLSAARLDRLASLAARVPLYHLAVPTALDSSARIHHAIARTLRA